MDKKITTLLLLSVGYFFYGQEISEARQVDEVFIQGNRLQIPFSEITRDIQIITQKEIAQLPVQSISDLLQYIGGVDIRQRGPFNAQADVSMDGGSFEETLVLLNGVKMINSQTAHNNLNLPVTLAAIDHIEVLRGAAARVYGINALTGAINIVTKKSKKSFLAADVFAGSSFKSQAEEEGDGIYAGGGIELTGNYGSDRQNHLWSVGQNLSNGERYNSAIKNTKAFYNGNFQFDSENEVALLAGYMYNRFGANGYYAAPGDLNSEEIVETSVFSISSKHRLGNFTLMPRLSDRYDEDDYRYFKDKLDVARSIHYTNALMAELNGNLKTNFGDFGIGWESRFEKINSSNIGLHDRSNHGAFAEYRGLFWNKLRSNLGLYANYNTAYGWQVYPGIDVSYLINEHWQVSANIGSAQRIPSYTDLYLDQRPGNIGNANIKPEASWQYEARLKYATNYFEMQAGTFYRNISDFIDWVRVDDTTPYSPVNFGYNKMFGFYTRISGRLMNHTNSAWRYRLSYNYLKPNITDNQGVQSKYVLENLKHQFLLGLSYAYRNFEIGFENRLIKRELNASYDVLDARISYRFNQFQIYGDLTNLFNAQYQESGAVPTSPRWFNLGLRFYIQKK